MSFGSLSSSLVTSVLGNTKKAKLVIHDTSDTMKIDSQSVAQSTSNALAAAAGAVSSALLGGKPKSYSMDVHYNPSTLSMQANAEPIPFTYLQQNVDNGIPNQNLRPPMVVLSVELVFDEMNTQDAFMMDKLRLSVGSVISNVAAVVKLFGGGYTVQPETNGLLATVLRPNTKLVTFAWADMAFTGQVIEVEARYTMFSPSGKPVRSQVRLNIAQQVESSADQQYWDKALEKTFDATNPVLQGLVDNLGGNLLNLNML